MKYPSYYFYPDEPLFFFPSSALHMTLKIILSPIFSCLFSFFECFFCINRTHKFNALEIQNVVIKEQARFKYRHYQKTFCANWLQNEDFYLEENSTI